MTNITIGDYFIITDHDAVRHEVKNRIGIVENINSYNFEATVFGVKGKGRCFMLINEGITWKQLDKNVIESKLFGLIHGDLYGRK